MKPTGRYVILRHDHPDLHWDFMLEKEGVLKTWRLPSPFESAILMGTALPDHRLAYLDYEGPVSGDRGTVVCWDRGVYEMLPAEEGFRALLVGDCLRAEVAWKHRPDGFWDFQFVEHRGLG